MLKVIINDFQSIQEAKFKIDGVTLIVGESNEGKSACLRAFQAACTNRFKAGQVRYGSDHASIKIKTDESDDVLTVVRSWAGGSPQMKLGSQVFSKLNRTIPKEVDEFLNLGFIDLNGEQYSCNFHTQFQKPMLLEYSQQKVMEILSASTALDDLKETKEYVLAERTKNKGAISAVEGLITRTKGNLEVLQGKINSLEPLVNQYEQMFLNYQAIQEQLDNLVKLRSLFDDEEACKIKESKLCDLINVSILHSENDLALTNSESLQCLLDEFDELNHKEHIIYQIQGLYNQDLESRLDKANYLASLLESQKVISNNEEQLSCKLNLLDSIIAKESFVQDLNRKRMQIDQLETNLSGLSIVTAQETSLVKVVEEHRCPICGNIVNE